ncbi:MULTISPECIES: QsdR family transcriptional regulator [Pseudonocardia]|uniref:QsdR TetR regulatory C-terminal domain-containing protein n=1 Tax=Pseudonocardia autotrophica TaxID=2074 RepID=A0A1Y2MN81_PSEAH|nr:MULTISPECIES: QsdR family transcriptional regulator [Pseudonocardia]OSY36117.1 hypothetical protein BG845_05632 [Pseudonocardia autotrophica]TDN77598.1 hypothetical protein C8E95_6848 [Pseudonocardia autotrophica]
MTPLQRQLSTVPPRTRVTPLDALKVAHRWFHEGRRIDIQALAKELGVSRVTLHRWVGTREQLLVEVLWLNADRALAATWATVRSESPAHSLTAETLSRWAADVLVHPGFRQMQASEGELLARLLTRDASEFQSRLIGLVTTMLADDVESGRVTIDLEPAELAYATVRIAESFVHTPAITGGDPDPERNARVLRALLR